VKPRSELNVIPSNLLDVGPALARFAGVVATIAAPATR